MRPHPIAAIAAGLVALLTALCPGEAGADERLLREVRDVHRACRGSRADARPRLYAVEIHGRGFRLGDYDPDEGFLPIDGRRNLRALGGAVELFAAGMEPVGFVATPERARELTQAVRRGAKLRVGFFLGFDGARGTVCLLRAPQAGVTTVRMDVAYVELLGPDGSVVAREDTERLRAWLDDAEESGLPGAGPRAAVSEVTLEGAAVPEAVQRALAADRPRLAAAGRCHAEGIARGATDEGHVVLRIEVDPRTGQVSSAEVELSTIGDDAEAECVARAYAALRLPVFAGPARARLRVPVRLSR